MSKKTFAFIPPGRSQFRRVLRDDAGKPLTDDTGAERAVVFQPGEPVELSDEELEAVRDDVGNAVYLATVKDGVAHPKQDEEATAAFVEQTAKLREKQAAARARAKANAKPAVQANAPAANAGRKSSAPQGRSTHDAPAKPGSQLDTQELTVEELVGANAPDDAPKDLEQKPK